MHQLVAAAPYWIDDVSIRDSVNASAPTNANRTKQQVLAASLGRYVCMYVCLMYNGYVYSMQLYVCVYICTCVCMTKANRTKQQVLAASLGRYVCMYVCVMHMCMLCNCVCVCVYIYIYVHAYMHTYIHTYIQNSQVCYRA